MNSGSIFFLEDIRMNWEIYEWIRDQIFFCGRYTNELGNNILNILNIKIFLEIGILQDSLNLIFKYIKYF